MNSLKEKKTEGAEANETNGFRIVELTRENNYLRHIESSYSTSHYYDVRIDCKSTYWKIQLTLKAFDATLEKTYHGKLFEDHIQEPRVFAVLQVDKQVGWIELGYDKWNNRMRVWEFLVENSFRRKGIGMQLMNYAVRVARQKQARMLMLETQTNNADAISFYLRFGFRFVGIDIAAYSNDDIGKKEVRLELGLEL